MLNVVLLEPEIPQNTGNISRTCAATGCSLHLVGPLGFSLEDRYLRRAGLDYWHLLDLHVYDDWAAFRAAHPGVRPWMATTKGARHYCDAAYRDGDWLLFGKETRGLPEGMLAADYERAVRLPMREGARSLNLSNSVAVMVYEALRQLGFPGLQQEGHLPKQG
jgi:tRNA (cytidine/uridine-2'-O-)-methyltransferase